MTSEFEIPEKAKTQENIPYGVFPLESLYLRVPNTQERGLAAWSYDISKEDRPIGAYKQLFVAKICL